MSGQIDETARIHPSAIIEDGATIGAHCRIGPYCVIGSDVTLGAGVILDSHVVVSGWTSIGDETRIWPFASIGSAPQDLKYKGERTEVRIGKNNMIREYVTVNSGTDGGGGLTRMGDGNLLMMHVHLAHDCDVGDNVIFANGVQVAGHVQIANDAVIGSMAGLHQFIRVGQGAMIGAGSMVVYDVIPFGTVNSPRGVLAGLNLIGLKRRGVDKDDINGLRRAYKELFTTDGALLEKARHLAEGDTTPLVEEVLNFLISDSDRSFCTPE